MELMYDSLSLSYLQIGITNWRFEWDRLSKLKKGPSQVLWLAYDCRLQFWYSWWHTGARSCDFGCLPWLCFRIGHKIMMTIFLLVWALRFISESGTHGFHLQMSGPQMGLGVSTIVRMPQWWSRQWMSWDAPHHQKVALSILSLSVHVLPLPVAPMTTVRYNLNGSLPTCLRLIVYSVILYWCFL